MKMIKLISLVSAFAALAGCAGGTANTSSAYTGDSFGNYKCYATSGSYTATGWASNRSDAEANALDKCKEHSGKSCSLTTCNDEGTTGE